MNTKEQAKRANVIGPNLRRFRMDAGLTQKELVALCEERGLNMTRGALAKIESCIRYVTACELLVLAKVLQIDIQCFFPPGFGDPAASSRRKST